VRINSRIKNKNYTAEYSRDDIVIVSGFLQWQIQCITLCSVLPISKATVFLVQVSDVGKT
jgi:type IV secretory pathway component VirB8